jgi:hypothetical protein
MFLLPRRRREKEYIFKMYGGNLIYLQCVKCRVLAKRFPAASRNYICYTVQYIGLKHLGHNMDGPPGLSDLKTPVISSFC